MTWLLLGLSCPAWAAFSLRDDRGVTHRFERSPQRIVTLLPSLTETVCALQACARLVGVDRFSNSPPQVVALPKLGGLEDAQVERIAALKPDVVLAAPSARVIDRLDDLGLKVVIVDAKTHADVQRSLGMVATLLGTPAEADRVWASIQRSLADAAARVPASVRGQKVYFEVDPTPYAAGAGSFIGETLQRLHMGNVIAPALGPFPRLNPEFVVKVRPDIIMASQRSLDDMPRRPGWASLPALQQRRSCGFDLKHYEVLIRPGPRMGEAALQLADCLASIEKAQR
ncbi:ABC transporter substrate-binding protein [Piscinibacter sp. HJYY11]|uniref:ABC transporter substrate-binding protein n=1 Tax=Piscinibacter sp. HJYY11 TaxID=2801333 RepID=UPI00191D9D07|nr:helical backbone metal receptor [Piscinibacter sp. HJYY11]MBL0727011.1 ABC transporter substrate-binding protein [Piscinibacter sp. HJYY11]